MGDFGKVNRSISFDRTSAFPLDAKSFFTSKLAAELAASQAVEVGSSDSCYYYGQTLVVLEKDKATLYIIQPDGTLSETGNGGNGSTGNDTENGEQEYINAELVGGFKYDGSRHDDFDILGLDRYTTTGIYFVKIRSRDDDVLQDDGRAAILKVSGWLDENGEVYAAFQEIYLQAILFTGEEPGIARCDLARYYLDVNNDGTREWSAWTDLVDTFTSSMYYSFMQWAQEYATALDKKADKPVLANTGDVVLADLTTVAWAEYYANPANYTNAIGLVCDPVKKTFVLFQLAHEVAGKTTSVMYDGSGFSRALESYDSGLNIYYSARFSLTHYSSFNVKDFGTYFPVFYDVNINLGLDYFVPAYNELSPFVSDLFDTNGHFNIARSIVVGSTLTDTPDKFFYATKNSGGYGLLTLNNTLCSYSDTTVNRCFLMGIYA